MSFRIVHHSGLKMLVSGHEHIIISIKQILHFNSKRLIDSTATRDAELIISTNDIDRIRLNANESGQFQSNQDTKVSPHGIASIVISIILLESDTHKDFPANKLSWQQNHFLEKLLPPISFYDCE